MPFDDDYGEGEMMVAGENASMFRQTSVIEHCMMVNGEERLRVKLTLSIAGVYMGWRGMYVGWRGKGWDTHTQCFL